jgi:hypothetical protein
MTKICNKAQIGSTMTLIVSTIAIIIILLLFALASTLFEAKAEIEKKATDFSVQSQAGTSLLSMLQSASGNQTVSDLIRISKVNPAYKEKAESELNALNNIYQKWALDAEGILLGDFTIFRDGIIVRTVIPDYEKNIKVALGVKNE